MLPLAALALAFAAGSPASQPQGRELLQPRTYASPSGRWSFRVEPAERLEPRNAAYTLTEDGRTAWSGRRPFVLWNADVTEDGQVVGISYSAPLRHAGGTLRVLLLSPSGEVLLDEPHERVGIGFSHADPVPRALRVFAQPELERFVVLVSDIERDGQRKLFQACWGYDLSTGAALFRHRLERESVRGAQNAYDARPLPGTSLTLLHWMRTDSSEPGARGAVFELVDADWEVVWILGLPHDYEVPDDDLAEESLRWEIWKTGAILSAGPSQFELRFVAKRQRVQFAVERAGPGWTVREIGRSPLVETAAPEVFRPMLLSRTTLDSEGLEDPGNARLDVGSARILVQDDRSHAIHVFDLEGRELLVCWPETDQLGDARQMFCDEGGRVFVAKSPYVARYMRFAADGTNEGFHEGAHGLWTHTRTAVLFQEASGKTSIALEKRPDGWWFRSIQDIALASDRSLAVLDVADTAWPGTRSDGPPCVSIFGPRGEPRRAVALPEAIGAREIVFGGTHVVVSERGETHLMDVETGALVELDLEEWLDPPGRRRELALSSDGSELWVLSAFEREFLRFALTE